MNNINKRRSPLWDHFTLIENKKAKCSYCGQILSIPSGNIGNFKRHMTSKHPTVPLIAERQTIKHLEPVEVYEKPCTSHSITPQVTSPPTSEVPACLSAPTMRDFVTTIKPLQPRRTAMLDEQLLKMIAKEYHPLRIVEEKEFRKFVYMLCPGYSLPSRKTLSESILTKIFEKTTLKVEMKLASAVAICLTIDGWTSITNESYLALTAHFISTSDKASKLESVLITCIEYTERHNSKNLCNFIKNATIQWKINNKISAIASDNAANITAAIREGDWRLISCFAHTLNLLVKEALTHISETVGKTKAIVEYFKRSSYAQQELTKLQTQMNLPQLKLKQDVSTRWNSTYEMLSRFIQCKAAIIATIALIRSDLSLNENDWRIIEAIVPIFSLFAEITNEISSEKAVTLSKVIPLCRIMFNNISNHMRVTQLPEVTTVLITVNNELLKRFGTVETNTLCCEATILDPRFKNKAFKDQRNYEIALGYLKNKVTRQTTPEAEPKIIPFSPAPSTSTSTKSIWDDFDKEVAKLTPQNSSAAGIVEIDKYVNEILLDRKRDPLIWWHERRLVYPLLYQYMLKRLNLVATSVPCERIFSKAGYTLNERRTRLKSKKLSQLLFISSNAE